MTGSTPFHGQAHGQTIMPLQGAFGGAGLTPISGISLAARSRRRAASHRSPWARSAAVRSTRSPVQMWPTSPGTPEPTVDIEFTDDEPTPPPA